MTGDTFYRPILKKSWAITKKFKGLWFFGLFSALLASGEFEILLRAISDPTSEVSTLKGVFNAFVAGWQNGLAFSGNAFLGLWQALTGSPLTFLAAVVLLIVLVAIGLFIIWLSVVSQVGLVNNVNELNKNRSITLNGGIEAGLKKFWPVLLADIILKAVLTVLAFLLGRELIALSGLGWTADLFYYLSFVIFVAFAIVASFLIRYQILFIILKNEKFLAALNSAWNLFKKNWLITIELALVLFIIYFVIAFVVSFIVVILLSIPFVLVFYFSSSLTLAAVISLIAFVLAVVIAALATAVFMTFQWSTWTLAFNQINAKLSLSKLIRVSQELREKLPF